MFNNTDELNRRSIFFFIDLELTFPAAEGHFSAGQQEHSHKFVLSGY